jgi:hypothetical protein
VHHGHVAGVGARRDPRSQLVERPDQLAKPAPCGRAHRDRRDPRQQLGDGGPGGRRVGHVGLRDRDDALRDRQPAEHRDVLDRLGHHAIVGRDREQVRVHPGRAGDHGAHEALVPRHVDDRARPARWEPERGVPERDRHPAPALLRQPIGVDARQRLDEGGLAMVHMPRRTDRER